MQAAKQLHKFKNYIQRKGNETTESGNASDDEDPLNTSIYNDNLDYTSDTSEISNEYTDNDLALAP